MKHVYGSLPTPMHDPRMNQPTQGMPMQGMPMQGMPMQGMPMQGMPMQGMPMPPMQGMSMSGGADCGCGQKPSNLMPAMNQSMNAPLVQGENVQMPSKSMMPMGPMHNANKRSPGYF
ncbi:hypothetical protein [Priestia flexa]|uniref:hypothetical protein n=1 Tax=Priestia flexa TaxID=86664 RepID=UPI001F4D15E9|nr:hypothetical protein [Priestia flexa]